MKYAQSLESNYIYPSLQHGQGIAAAPKAYFAKQSMERKWNCGKPGFCRRQKWPKRKTNSWHKGIELINELDGGIEVNCKKLNIKRKNINLKAEKNFTIKTDGNVSFKEMGNMTFTYI